MVSSKCRILLTSLETYMTRILVVGMQHGKERGTNLHCFLCISEFTDVIAGQRGGSGGCGEGTVREG
jgi:hypothetical protein